MSPEFDLPLTRAEAVTNALRRKILSGDLAPGAPVTDAQIATRLGVSITPVREAIAQLISDGLIEALPNKRRRVTALTMGRAIELMDTFGILMVAALRRAVSQFDGVDRAVLRQASDEYTSASDRRDKPGASAALDRYVHVIAAAAKNVELQELIDTTATRSYRLFELESGSPLWEVWSVALSEVVDLIAYDRATQAVERLDTHFNAVVAAMRDPKAGLGIVLRPGSILSEAAQVNASQHPSAK